MAPTNAQTALAMRNGAAWPVIFTDYSRSAYTLIPAGGMQGGGSWQKTGGELFTKVPYRLRAASSPDGRVAVTGSDGSGMGVGGAVSTAQGGWSTLPTNAKAAVFNEAGNLLTATRESVPGPARYPGGPAADYAISPAGDIGVIDLSMKYWQYSPWVGTWLSTDLGVGGPHFTSDSMDLEFDAMSRPHVVGIGGSAIWALDFSTVTGTWTSTMLTNALRGTSYVTLATNSKGEIGTAWADAQDNALVYACKDDNEDWTLNTVTTGASLVQRMVGIAYDYADLPVLSHISDRGEIMLAYDPVMVPEPAALTLLGLVGLLALRRRHRA